MQVTFLPMAIKQNALKGDNLLDLIMKAGLMLDVSCGRMGTCGKCRVRILSGQTNPPDSAELSTLTSEELALGYRLACRLKVMEDLEVFVPEIGDEQSSKTRAQCLPLNFKAEKTIEKYAICVPPASLDHQMSDCDRIIMAMPGLSPDIDPNLLKQIPALLASDNGALTVAVRNGCIIALEAGDTTASSYGIAFDIGTTTVAGMLWDLKKAEMLGAVAKTNPQNVFGADVISRIQATLDCLENLKNLQEKIKTCLNDIIEEFKMDYKISEDHIYEVTIVGNTTMSHLLLGIDPSSLAQTPFAPVFCKACNFSGREFSLSINPLANVHLLPNIAGHVGSDITGVLLATDLINRKGLHLAIDVGTNGEILLAKDGQVCVCSTAAGPAFEGARIKCGMRAADGAIEGIEITEGEVRLEVIGRHKPIGICGSGLIDGIAQLLSIGLIDRTGRLKDQDSAIKDHQPDSLTGRLRDGEEGREFVLYLGNDAIDVVITQKDIRQVQLAKGAIAAGIHILRNTLPASDSDWDSISLAGAFGNNLRKESALRIGLLPNISMDKIAAIGNAAGTGACMALLSVQSRKEAGFQSELIKHIELAGRKDFETEFIHTMSFPE